VSNADDHRSPALLPRPDPGEENRFEPIATLIETLREHYPTVSVGQRRRDLVEHFETGLIRVQDDDGQDVPYQTLENRARLVDDDKLVYAPDKPPIRLASWYDFVCRFWPYPGGDPVPASGLPPGTNPLLIDYFAHVWSAVKRGRPWPSEPEDLAWGKKHGLTKPQVQEIRRVTRSRELKLGGNR
jgi:hypothetical protein